MSTPSTVDDVPDSLFTRPAQSPLWTTATLSIPLTRTLPPRLATCASLLAPLVPTDRSSREPPAGMAPTRSTSFASISVEVSCSYASQGAHAPCSLNGAPSAVAHADGLLVWQMCPVAQSLSSAHRNASRTRPIALLHAWRRAGAL